MTPCERSWWWGVRLPLLLAVLLQVQTARPDLLLADDKPLDVVDVRTTLECHPRVYNSTVTRTDRNGRICYDHVSVTSCWGRCDSNEISDYRFPYKRSHHPVCLHDVRVPTVKILRHCEEGVEPGTERYEYLEAKKCSCQVCKSSEASCEGLRYRAVGGHGGPAPGATPIISNAIPAAIEQLLRPLVIDEDD